MISEKVIDKKNVKKNMILEKGFELFTERGIHSTTVQNIVDKAGLAKGTFYLYFHDKYELQDELIFRQSKMLFDNAVKNLDTNVITSFEDQLIFVIDSILDELSHNVLLLKFISKNLSWGIYNEKLNNVMVQDNIGIRDLFLEGIKKENLNLENPDVTLYMIIELVSSLAFSSIVSNKPLPIKEFKPYLYDSIRKLLN